MDAKVTVSADEVFDNIKVVTDPSLSQNRVLLWDPAGSFTGSFTSGYVIPLDDMPQSDWLDKHREELDSLSTDMESLEAGHCNKPNVAFIEEKAFVEWCEVYNRSIGLSALRDCLVEQATNMGLSTKNMEIHECLYYGDGYYTNELAPIIANGKGDIRRPPQVDKQTYDKNWETVFGDKRKHVCREFVRDKQGVSRCYHCDEPQEVPF